MNEVKGIISKSKGEPVSVEKVLIPDPGPGEVLVEVKACGVCHTDLHYREGAISNDFPFFLGHEAARAERRDVRARSPRCGADGEHDGRRTPGALTGARSRSRRLAK